MRKTAFIGGATWMNLRIVSVAAAASIMAASGARADNLVINGSFETGDFTGWTVTGGYPQGIDESGGFENGAACEDGSYCAQIAGYSDAPDFTSQTIRTDPGQSYVLSFWVWQDAPASPTVSLNVTWNGTSLLSYLNPDVNLAYWNEYTFNVVAAGSDVLEFTGVNDCCYSYLDNVQLNGPPPPVPEPATWAMMLTGFGAIGACLRSWRRVGAAHA
jgi:hypothetical protein